MSDIFQGGWVKQYLHHRCIINDDCAVGVVNSEKFAKVFTEGAVRYEAIVFILEANVLTCTLCFVLPLEKPTGPG